MSIICPRCNSTVQENQRFCPTCLLKVNSVMSKLLSEREKKKQAAIEQEKNRQKACEEFNQNLGYFNSKIEKAIGKIDKSKFSKSARKYYENLKSQLDYYKQQSNSFSIHKETQNIINEFYGKINNFETKYHNYQNRYNVWLKQRNKRIAIRSVIAIVLMITAGIGTIYYMDYKNIIDVSQTVANLKVKYEEKKKVAEQKKIIKENKKAEEVAQKAVDSEIAEKIKRIKSLSTNITYNEYNLGGIGPGGGIIFYDKGSYSNGWRYLECSPKTVCECPWSDYICELPLQKTGMGSGEFNTYYIISELGNNNAAAKAANYECNGYSDWYLGSSDEYKQLVKFCKNSKIKKIIKKNGMDKINGGLLSNTIFWTSEYLSNQKAAIVYGIRGFTGQVFDGNLTATYWVRPIRKF